MPAVDRARLHCGSQRLLEVSAWHHDESVAPAQLEHTLLDFASGCAAHGTAGFFASRECDRFDSWIDNQLLHPVGLDEKGLKNAFIKSGPAKNLFNGERALRNIGRMFEETDVSGHQSRRGKPKHLPEWKIPRHDREHRPNRFISDVTAGGVRLRWFIFQKSFRVFRIVTATASALFDFLHRGAKQLSHLERDGAGELILFLFKERSRRHHQLRAFGEWFAPMMRKRSLGSF